MDISFSDGFSYTSANSCSYEMCFYSAPTSPNRFKLSALSGFETQPITPSTYEYASSNLDEFEFETSQHFNLGGFNTETSQTDENSFGHMQEQSQRFQRHNGDPLPNMAFADELFCDGKVLPLVTPLKLPPMLLCNENGNKMSTQSSTASSARSQGLVFRLPFSSHSLWNDDFDPFMVALEKVKEEKKKRKPKGKHGLEPKLDEAVEAPLKREPLKKAPRSINMLLSEPKGLVFPKQIRVGNDEPFEPKGTLLIQHELGRGGFCARKMKREQIMKFLLRCARIGKVSAKHKLEALVKPAFLRKLGLEPGATMHVK